jgi:hypothetical protein
LAKDRLQLEEANSISKKLSKELEKDLTYITTPFQKLEEKAKNYRKSCEKE